MTGFVFEGRDKTQRTKHEKIAISNMAHAVNWILGGYYNCIQDDLPEYLPESRQALENEIYTSALNNFYAPGCEFIGRAPREMRFAGEAFCRAYIRYKLEHDGDYLEIAEFKGW